MSLTKLPSGRYRAQVYDGRTRKNVRVSEVLGLPKGTTWESKREAKIAREKAREVIHSRQKLGITVGEFWGRWTTDPLFARPKESTNIHNRERTRAFVDAHKDRELASIADIDVARWLAGGERVGQVPALRAMFNDARSPLAGRLVERNPFANLRLKKRSRAQQEPPDEAMVEKLRKAAEDLGNPSWVGWLWFAMWTGMRPGEIDALRWSDVDLETGIVTVSRQFNAKVRAFTSPKTGGSRPVVLTPQARAAVEAQPDGPYVFVNLRGDHWTPGSRAYWWKATKAAAGWKGSPYLATRHRFASYAINVLLLPPEDVALALGHGDGGALVREVYGHRDRDQGLQRVKEAFDGR